MASRASSYVRWQVLAAVFILALIGVAVLVTSSSAGGGGGGGQVRYFSGAIIHSNASNALRRLFVTNESSSSQEVTLVRRGVFPEDGIGSRSTVTLYPGETVTAGSSCGAQAFCEIEWIIRANTQQLAISFHYMDNAGERNYMYAGDFVAVKDGQRL